MCDSHHESPMIDDHGRGGDYTGELPRSTSKRPARKFCPFGQRWPTQRSCMISHPVAGFLRSPSVESTPVSLTSQPQTDRCLGAGQRSPRRDSWLILPIT